MKKRIISSVICMLLSFTVLSGTAFAGAVPALSIAGTDVTTGYWKNNDTNSGVVAAENESSANAYFVGDPNTEGTLYLNGLNVTTPETASMPEYGIISLIPLTIDLTGANSITTADGSKTDSVALLVDGDLTVTGDGSLTANAGDVVNNNSTGVSVTGKLTQESGTLTGNGGKANSSDGNTATISVGVEAGEIEVTGGSLTGTGGSAKVDSFGIKANVDITASGSAKISGTSDSSGSRSGGILTQGALTASDTATVTGTGDDSGHYSMGVAAHDAITAEDSAKISGTGGNCDGSSSISYGIFAETTLSVSDCATIEAVGGSASSESYGICSQPAMVKGAVKGVSASITVNGGLLSATGGMAHSGSYGINTDSQPVRFIDGVIIANTTEQSEYFVSAFTDSLALPESFYWRTSPTAAFSHFPEDGFTNEATSYLELRTKLPPAVEATVYTVEKTDEGFLVKADFNAFIGVWVDGEEVDSENYTVKAAEDGTIIITLTEAFLKTLPKGEHILRINFTDGYAVLKFTVE